MDLENLTDEELKKIAGLNDAQPSLDVMSDEELAKIAGIEITPLVKTEPLPEIDSKRLEVAQNAINDPLLKDRYIELTGSEPEVDLAIASERANTLRQSEQSAPVMQPIQENKPSKLGSFYRNLEQGATFGFGDEAKASLAALYAKYLGGKATENLSLGNLTNLANQQQAEQLKQDYETNPISSFAGNIVGGIGTGGAIAGTKAGKALFDAYRNAGLGGKIIQGAATGAATSGLTGAGQAESGKRLEGAQDAALLGAGVGGAIPVIGAALQGVANKGVDILKKLSEPKILKQANADDLREMAQAAYKVADDAGGVLKAEKVNKFVERINALKPQQELTQKTFGVSASDDLIDSFKNNLKDKNLSLKEFDELDKGLTDAIYSAPYTEMGRITPQGKKLLELQDSLRGMVETATDADTLGGVEGFKALKPARDLYSRSMRLRDIEAIIEKASNTDTPAKSMATAFNNLANNPKRLKGYSKDEIKLIKKAAKTGIVTDLGRLVGSRLNAIIAGSAGGLGAAATAQGLGMAGRGLANKIQVGKAQELAAKIAAPANVTKAPTIINKAAQSLLNKIQNGYKPTAKEINSLPTKDAVKILEVMRFSTPAQVENAKNKPLKINIPY